MHLRVWSTFGTGLYPAVKKCRLHDEDNDRLTKASLPMAREETVIPKTMTEENNLTGRNLFPAVSLNMVWSSATSLVHVHVHVHVQQPHAYYKSVLC